MSVAVVLLFVAILKFVLTSFSFGVKVPGGLWMPLIAVGACIGRAIGIFMRELEQ